ncbi:hypothetical protein HDU67_002140 [Dinochytrium kinnereticum]|nr:hypothetical protein HDU67_002140 [Dinochytrium kinnereticum]
MMKREGEKPDTLCRFLWPGAEGNEYFGWRVWAERNPVEAAEIENRLNPSQPPPTASDTSNDPVITGLTHLFGDAAAKQFAHLLESLWKDCSQSNIQVG